MRQNALTALVVVLLLGMGFIWFRFIRAPAADPSAPAAQPYSEDDDIRQFRLLKNLNLDQSLFADPAFRELVKFGGIAPTGDLPRGRAQPFGPF